MVVHVTNEHFEGNKKVLFKMGKKDGRAIMTKNWREVVEGARMKKDQMAIFRFMERSGGGLRVNMVSGMRIRWPMAVVWREFYNLYVVASNCKLVVSAFGSSKCNLVVIGTW